MNTVSPGSKATLKWRGKNRARFDVYQQVYRATVGKLPANKAKAALHNRTYRLKKYYNITPEEWKKIFDHQGGCCAMCRRPASDFKNGLHVDHDHSSKLIRGLLCWNCNDLLPNRGGLVELFRRAIEYLTLPPAVIALGEERLCGKPRPTRKLKWKYKLASADIPGVLG